MDSHRRNQDVSEYSYQKNRSKLSNSNFFCSGIINLLFDGLAYNTSGHFAHCSYFSSPLRGLEKYYATRKISALYAKPSNKVCLLNVCDADIIQTKYYIHSSYDQEQVFF